MTPAQAIQRAEKGDLLPVWLFVGEERLLRDQAVAAIMKAALAGGLAEVNTDKYTAGEADVDKILGATRTVPMMAKKRLVLVRSLERWDGSSESTSDDAKAMSPLDRSAEYAKDPTDSACLVPVAQKLDGRRKL